MPWIRLDDHFTEHPKLAALSDAAFRSHVEALCYCGRNLTDGFMSSRIATFISRTDNVMRELVGSVWDEEGNDYRIHDYLEYQMSRAEILELRRMRQASGQAGGQASAKARAQAKSKQNGKQNSKLPSHSYSYPSSHTHSRVGLERES